MSDKLITIIIAVIVATIFLQNTSKSNYVSENGCTDPKADNYNSMAIYNDQSCEYTEFYKKQDESTKKTLNKMIEYMNDFGKEKGLEYFGKIYGY